MNFSKWLFESQNYNIQALIDVILQRYPFVNISAYESKDRIELEKIILPPEKRGAGVGTAIIKIIQDYASKVGKPIVLHPEAEKGHKKDLENFYKSLGFVYNKGLHKDFVLSSMAKTMYWKPASLN